MMQIIVNVADPPPINKATILSCIQPKNHVNRRFSFYLLIFVCSLAGSETCVQLLTLM